MDGRAAVADFVAVAVAAAMLNSRFCPLRCLGDEFLEQGKWFRVLEGSLKGRL